MRNLLVVLAIVCAAPVAAAIPPDVMTAIDIRDGGNYSIDPSASTSRACTSAERERCEQACSDWGDEHLWTGNWFLTVRCSASSTGQLACGCDWWNAPPGTAELFLPGMHSYFLLKKT